MARLLPLRQLLAVLILPFTVNIVVPALLYRYRGGAHALAGHALAPIVRMAGALLVVAGVTLAATSIGLFSRVGEGTLAPWDPTRKLVVRGPYRRVRNPMISGVMAILLGEAALLGTRAQLLWFLAFVVANAIWIPLVEEPGLLRRFGEAWREYARNVPRWIPRLRPWDPGR